MVLALGEQKAVHFTTDVNGFALATTLRTAEANAIPRVEVHRRPRSKLGLLAKG